MTRSLRRHWKLTAIATFSLAIAMALGILALSISNTALLLQPNVPDPDRLVTMHDRTATEAVAQISYPDYQFYRQNARSFTDIAGAPNSIGINEDFNFEGRRVTVLTRPVPDNYFAVLGIRPHLGRFFSPGDDQNDARLAVMTWNCWQRLGADPHIVGKVLAKYTVVGVTPPGFSAGFYGFEGDLFSTFRTYDDSPWREDRTARRLNLTARLKPGVTRTQAQAEIAGLSAQLASAYPKEDKGRTAVVARASLLPPDAIPTAQWMTAILIAFVLLVLLIACANVANLLLAIAVGRRQEAAIKLALGAPRARLIRDFLAESAILCFAGGVLGYAIAAAVIARFSHFTMMLPTIGAFSFGLHLRLDATVAGLALLLTLIAGLATGLAPALYASSPALAQILGGELAVGGTRKQTRRNALVVVQVTVCTLVLIGMGLCQRNLYNLRHVDLGFSARNLVTATVYSDSEGYSAERRPQFHETLRRTIAALPGVDSVTLAMHIPLAGTSQIHAQFPDGGRQLGISHTMVDPDFFATIGIKVIAGRTFNSNDRPKGQPVTIVNQKLAEMFWPGQNPIGQLLTAGQPAGKFLVVGVAANAKYLDLDEAVQPFLYLPLSQHDQTIVNVIARTRHDPRLWIAPMAKALRGLGLKIDLQPETLETWISLDLITQRIAAGFAAILSALGLLLAVIGLFGAISYSVSERKKELGIRVALGAIPRQLLVLILRQTLVIAGTGVILGTLLGVAATVIFRSQMYGIAAVEWTVLVPVALGMLLLSLLVAALSARPWLTVDPMESVRHA